MKVGIEVAFKAMDLHSSESPLIARSETMLPSACHTREDCDKGQQRPAGNLLHLASTSVRFFLEIVFAISLR